MKQTTAIVLAAGQGKRMNSKVHKQYLLIQGKPVIYYTLNCLEKSFIDNIVLVVGAGEEAYCKKEIVEKYAFQKVKTIVPGGKERYHSVYAGLKAITWENDMVYIHDGARPFLTEDMLQRAYEATEANGACVLGMPVKDTVKIADECGFVKETPDRACVWQIQTPQVFRQDVIMPCYEKLMEQEAELLQKGIRITDDAMVVEYFGNMRIKLVEGSYKNMKITTPEDLDIAETFLKTETAADTSDSMKMR